MDTQTKYAHLAPTSLDMWIAVICICYVFKGHTPWYVWMFASFEFIGAMAVGIVAYLGKKK